MKILVLNAGSSSQKSRLYDIGDTLPIEPPEPLWEGDADWTKEKGAAEITIHAHGKTVKQQISAGSRPEIVEQLLKTMWSGETQVIEAPNDIELVGHRVVHGGPRYSESIRITPEVKEEIRRLSAFAPLHNPVNLEGIETIEHILPAVPQIAVFDTAFHSHIPLEVMVYPGPYSWYEQGIRRYGFHGTSHQYCSERAAHILGRDLDGLRIINCHLGNGCSLAAIQHGHSIDTTMGFTPIDGLMMGTRSGSIDPGILTYLLREQHATADQLDEVLNKQSGFIGISSVSSDLRQVEHARTQGNERAKLAIDMFIYRLRFFMGAMLASLGGV
ncbi:MAG TPA: acetate/propionate family kinase, partial [Ktedonobacteraceae bacterium]|nr:acetate/propionate family kinase [Ktedonobacteraceae bacterium]